MNFNLIFPWLESSSAKRKIDDKIQNILSNGVDSGLEVMIGYERLKIEELKEFYKSTFEVKSSLEDKIKSSLFSITLGITIQALAVSLLFNDGIGKQSVCFRSIVFIIGIASLCYLLMAGYHAIKAISEEIVIYKLSASEMSAKKSEELKKAYAACVELNTHANTIRNNILSVTYRSIVIGLCLIVIFFVLVGGASLFIGENKDKEVKIDMKLHPNWDEIQLIKSDIKNLPKSSDMKSLEDKNTRQYEMIELMKKEVAELKIKIQNLETKSSSVKQGASEK